ncbi:MAG TPA: tRNA (adenosine(37)-N6)-dimethylallyltransferase MiaA [Verrucomicrobiae bacterium]|jgi:tRNA dimethylallyltransferase|nr:tRNA (adenosine(37)-N6)-dimethylallyltransferase MiaA [Verrucomicrobiae bacterium]
MRPKIVIILGATAVGKSAVGLRLAETVNGEIVNADSQQVYRHMDIGTGKPSKADRERVRHHLIDIVAPNEEFNAALFRRLASDSIGQIHARQRNVIVCGGTGLYLRALTHGLFEGPGQDPAVRHALEQEIANSGLAVLYERLEKIDPTVGATIHRNDRQRIIRALEVYQVTGRPLSEWQKEHGFQEEPFDILKIGLLRERAELYDLINLRSERMIKDGFLEEVRGLVARGFDLTLKPLRSVGYRQMGQVLRGLQSLEDALEEMKRETRHLAKRQLTWFRRDEEIQWYHPEKQQREILQSAENFL